MSLNRTTKKIEEIVAEDEKIKMYNNVKPYLVRLFTHALLLFISIKAYNNYILSTESYSDFISLLDKKVLIDAKLISEKYECEEDYEDIIPYEFPEISEGCRCDAEIYTKDVCQYIRNSYTFDNYQNNKYCKFLSKYYSGQKIEESEYPDDFNSTHKEKIKKEEEYYDRKSPNNQNINNKRSLFKKILSKYRFLSEDLLYDVDKVNEYKITDSVQHIPESCKCYKKINKQDSFNITVFIPGKRLCIKKHPKLTVIKWLRQTNSDCDKENICQKYFCKYDNDPNEQCPIVDLYFNNEYRNPNMTDADFLFRNDDKTHYNLVIDREYNRTNLSFDDYIKKIYTPITGVQATMQGKCNNDLQNQFTSYSIFNNYECSRESRNIIANRFKIKEVLNTTYHKDLVKCKSFKKDNANPNSYICKGEEKDLSNPNEILNYDENLEKTTYYNQNFKINLDESLFENKITDHDTFSIELDYSLFRDTPTCLLKKLSFDNYIAAQNKKNDIYTAQSIKKDLKYALYVFINMDYIFNFQSSLQLYLLIVNCSIVGVNTIVIILSSIRLAKKNAKLFASILYYEVYVSFFVDVVSGVVGAYSYFKYVNVVSLCDELVSTGCLGNYEEYKLTVYANDLDDVLIENLQIFLIMLIKIFLITVNILVYIGVKKCKITFNKFIKIVYENLHEGDEDDAPESKEEILEEEKKNTKMQYIENSYNKNSKDVNVLNYNELNKIKEETDVFAKELDNKYNFKSNITNDENMEINNKYNENEEKSNNFKAENPANIYDSNKAISKTSSFKDTKNNYIDINDKNNSNKNKTSRKYSDNNQKINSELIYKDSEYNNYVDNSPEVIKK